MNINDIQDRNDLSNLLEAFSVVIKNEKRLSDIGIIEISKLFIEMRKIFNKELE